MRKEQARYGTGVKVHAIPTIVLRISIPQTRIVGVIIGEIASSLLVIAAWMGLLS